MKDTIMKTILFGVVVFGLIISAIYFGHRNKQQQIMVIPADPAPAPMEPLRLPPKEEKVYSASFIRGYHDGYSGSWLAPARWMIANRYRAGWDGGKQDRAAGLPNKCR